MILLVCLTLCFGLLFVYFLVLKFVLRLFWLLSVKVYCANRHLYFRVFAFVYFEFKYFFLDFLFNCLCAFPLSYECMCECLVFFFCFVNWKMERKVTERFLSTTNVCVCVCVFLKFLFTVDCLHLCLVISPLVQLYSHLHLLSSTFLARKHQNKTI